MSQSHLIRFAEMENLTQILDSAQRGIADRLAELDSEAEKLKGQWTGEAAAAYEAAHAKWAVAFTEMSALLAQATDITGDVTRVHRAAQQKVKKIWG